jgi:hypothetical protein
MESKEGTGLIKRHARNIELKTGNKIDIEKLPRPTGGDYMRMWTKVLVEDEENDDNLGRNFDAFYFVGPSDVLDFFTRGGALTVTAGVEEYFARKFTMDPSFRDYYSVHGINWNQKLENNTNIKNRQENLREEWEEMRKRFFRFYAVRASIAFSLGSHDEWNILRLLNNKRLEASRNEDMPSGDVGNLIAGFFDNRQIPPSAATTNVSNGYAFSSRS